MQISFSEVKRMFHDVVMGTVTFDEADRWAQNFLQISEHEKLTFFPADAGEKIWSAILYLNGIDLCHASGEPMYDREGVRREYMKLFGEPLA